jgi:hypothetical protein
MLGEIVTPPMEFAWKAYEVKAPLFVDGTRCRDIMLKDLLRHAFQGNQVERSKTKDKRTRTVQLGPY